MQNFLTTADTTYNTHPDILLTHGQTMALLPYQKYAHILTEIQLELQLKSAE